MQQHVTLITLGVADLARSRAFYVDGHRWELAHNPGITVGEDGTVRFAAPA